MDTLPKVFMMVQLTQNALVNLRRDKPCAPLR